MINSYSGIMQYRNSEIIILGYPKIKNLFILILIPGLKLLCLSALLRLIGHSILHIRFPLQKYCFS